MYSTTVWKLLQAKKTRDNITSIGSAGRKSTECWLLLTFQVFHPAPHFTIIEKTERRHAPLEKFRSFTSLPSNFLKPSYWLGARGKINLNHKAAISLPACMMYCRVQAPGQDSQYTWARIVTELILRFSSSHTYKIKNFYFSTRDWLPILIDLGVLAGEPRKRWFQRPAWSHSSEQFFFIIAT